MPAYGTVSAPAIPVLTPGRPIVLMDGTETPLTNGYKTERFCLHRHDLPAAVSVVIVFNQAPGAFSLDFEADDSDTDANYCADLTVTDGQLNSSGKVCRMEIPVLVATYGRLKFTAAPAAVGTKATITVQ